MDKKLKEKIGKITAGTPTPMADADMKKRIELQKARIESQHNDSARQAKPGEFPKEKLSVDKEYLQYRLDELIKANSNVISEYSYLMSVLHPQAQAVKE